MPCWLPASLGGASPTPETPDAMEEVGEGGPSGLAEGPERPWLGLGLGLGFGFGLGLGFGFGFGLELGLGLGMELGFGFRLGLPRCRGGGPPRPVR